MGRRRIHPGDPCRNGHPWNRTSDGKRCLDCHPNATPFALLSAEEQKSRADRLAARQAAWAARREANWRARREARAKNPNVTAEERSRRDRKKRDRCVVARRGLLNRAGPAGAKASTPELRALWAAQDGKCALTGLPIAGVPHLDHIVPASAGGSHTIDNLQWVSAEANMAKRDKSVAEFEEWLLAAADSLRAKRKERPFY